MQQGAHSRRQRIRNGAFLLLGFMGWCRGPSSISAAPPVSVPSRLNAHRAWAGREKRRRRGLITHRPQAGRSHNRLSAQTGAD